MKLACYRLEMFLLFANVFLKTLINNDFCILKFFDLNTWLLTIANYRLEQFQIIIQCFSKTLINKTFSGVYKLLAFVCLTIDAYQLSIRLVPIDFWKFPKTNNFKVFFAFFIGGSTAARLKFNHFCVLKTLQNNDYLAGKNRWTD